MHFLNQLFSRYTNPNRRRVKQLLKNLLLESLEQRIALDASGSPTLDALSDVTIDENAPEQTCLVKAEEGPSGSESHEYSEPPHPAQASANSR